MIKKPLLIACFVLSLIQCVNAQFSKPFIRNYTPKEYNAFFQNWDIAQDKNGVMYFANNFGVLVFNGNDWQTISNRTNSIIRSVELLSDGRIFVGGYDDLGFLKQDDKGGYEYESLVDIVPEDSREFGNVWNIEEASGAVYFSTDKYIFKYSDNSISRIEKRNGKLFKKIGNKIYTIHPDLGLCQFNNDKLDSIPNGNFFRGKKVYAVAELSRGILAVTREEGLFFLNRDTLYSIGDEKTRKILASSNLYGAEELPDGNICITTLKNGVIIINQVGEIVEIYNAETGLQNETCWGAFHDKQGNLWLALDKGISKIEYNCPFSLYNQNVGIQGTIMSIKRFDGKLYLATSVGLYQVNTKETELGGKMMFDIVPDINSQCWDLEEINDHLIIATSGGTFSMNKSGKVVRVNNSISYTIKKSEYYTNLLYIGSQNEMSIVVFDRQWKEYKLDSIEYEVRSIFEESESSLWIGTYLNGGINIKFELDEHFKPFNVSHKAYSFKEGLMGYEVDVFSSNNEVVFSTDRGLMKVDVSKEPFVFYPDTSMGKMFGDSTRIIYRLKEDFLNNTWMYAKPADDNSGISSLGFVKKHNEIPIWNSSQFNRLPQGIIYAFFPEANGDIWLGGVEGLVKYNYIKNTVKYNSIFYTLINSIKIGADSLLHNGFGITSNSGVNLKYINNTVEFNYSSTNFLDEGRNMFQFKLEGFDNEWSDWNGDVKKQYTNLYEGDYVFRVRSKNIYEDMGIESKYRFSILPPWYRTWWAYAIYVVVFICIIVLVVRLSVYRLKLKNERLEEIISDRTAEIREKNNQLGEALSDIKDSIAYAKRLQDAFLPEKKEIDRHFKNNFIMYLPRDIVSGDFYWMSEVDGKRIFAVADCTGHGVPGAFVSMLGNDLLNNIVNERGENNTSKILTALNQGVQNVFKSEDSTTITNDGMDICLISVDKKNKLQYSGAHRPLILVRHNELKEIKADKTSIGGRTDTEFKFNDVSIELEKGDTVYMYSDGFADQFGGPKGKKFLTKKLKQLLLDISSLGMEQQQEQLANSFNDWKGSLDQLDDVLLVGIKI